MDLGRIMGVGRMGILAGVVVVTITTLGKMPTFAWGGVALTTVSLVVNSVGKIIRYSRIDTPVVYRVLVVGAWLLLVTCLLGLVTDYTYSQFNDDYEGYFWSLAVAAFGFTLIYQGMRSKFVRGNTTTSGG